MLPVKASTLFGVPTMSRADHYPQLRPLRQAMRSQDWPGVTRFFAELSIEHDPSVAVGMVAELRGVEKFLESAGGGPAHSTLAATLLGARWVVMGWEARTARRASSVSRGQFAQFHDFLARADNLLGDVVTAEPGNVAAWTTRFASPAASNWDSPKRGNATTGPPWRVPTRSPRSWNCCNSSVPSGADRSRRCTLSLSSAPSRPRWAH
ncbi:hypothetical protein [Micromonospora sp. NPDC049679]|uniref:hypothetical protein n=1 Tax=Micromonospora sp. NPDC049679 TaxID=3155920 RepID=UPI0033F8C083